MEKIRIYLLNPQNVSTRSLNCHFYISITNCRKHYLRLGSNGRVQICKSIRPTSMHKSIFPYLLHTRTKFNFSHPHCHKIGETRVQKGKQKLAAQMTAWITTILIIITLLAILYTIFKKCRYVSSLPKGMLPLVPI